MVIGFQPTRGGLRTTRKSWIIRSNSPSARLFLSSRTAAFILALSSGHRSRATRYVSDLIRDTLENTRRQSFSESITTFSGLGCVWDSGVFLPSLKALTIVIPRSPTSKSFETMFSSNRRSCSMRFLGSASPDSAALNSNRHFVLSGTLCLGSVWTPSPSFFDYGEGSPQYFGSGLSDLAHGA